MGGMPSGKSMLSKVDLLLSQMALLLWVALSPGCHVQEIADGLSLSAPAVSVSIGRLIKSGLSERLRNPDDGRATWEYFSKHGQELQ